MGSHVHDAHLHVQVELSKHVSSESAGDSSQAQASTVIVRSCIARVPRGYPRIDIDAMQDDAIWGVDGFDT
jgi:hypothetical protein